MAAALFRRMRLAAAAIAALPLLLVAAVSAHPVIPRPTTP
jgi:hypothetical protein